MIHERVLAALNSSHPATDHTWMELEEMARSAPETAIGLVVELAQTPLEPAQRGWLAAGPLRSALASANTTEEEELELRAEHDPQFAALLDALLRYEQKQQVVVSLLEGQTSEEVPPRSENQQIVIPNIHERPPDHPIPEEGWSKIVSAVETAPENALLMLASTVIETLLLQNESVFGDAILEQIQSDQKFRRTLSYCDLAFSEPFLDELIERLRR